MRLPHSAAGERTTGSAKRPHPGVISPWLSQLSCGRKSTVVSLRHLRSTVALKQRLRPVCACQLRKDGTLMSCRRRMDEVRQMEHRATVEDLMYAAVLEKFLSLGVDMLGNMDNIMEKVMHRIEHPGAWWLTSFPSTCRGTMCAKQATRATEPWHLTARAGAFAHCSRGLWRTCSSCDDVQHQALRSGLCRGNGVTHRTYTFHQSPTDGWELQCAGGHAEELDGGRAHAGGAGHGQGPREERHGPGRGGLCQHDAQDEQAAGRTGAPVPRIARKQKFIRYVDSRHGTLSVPAFAASPHRPVQATVSSVD